MNEANVRLHPWLSWIYIYIHI